MEIQEIFKELYQQNLKGFMLHHDYATMYDFLNLEGYKTLEEYRAKSEYEGLNKLIKYYISHYNRLIPDERVDPVDVIPADWYAHVKQDVDINTKRTAVKNGFEKWVEWEKQTKDLYQRMYKELVEIGEIDSSLFIGDCIKDVSHELEKAEYMHINLASVDYAIDCILDVQDQLHDEYAEKIKAC